MAHSVLGARRLLRSRSGCGAIAVLFVAMLSVSGHSGAATESTAVADEIFFNGFEQFILSVNDYFSQCSVSVNGGAATSAPQPMPFPEGVVVSLHAEANPGFVWLYWSGTDGGEPDSNQDTVVAMLGDREVLACCQVAGQTTCGPTLTVTKSGSGDGTVSSDIPGIGCGDDCSENYPANSEVALTAVAASGSTFAGWSGSGCSGIGTCVVTINSVLAVTATFDAIPPNIVFVTSTTSTGNRGGLAGADAVCQQRAMSVGRAGTYRAWLSTTTVNAKDRIAGARGWVRIDGKPVADQIGDIVSGHLFYPISVDENGVFVGEAAAATGTDALGNFSTGDCASWTSTALSTVAGLASLDASGFTQWNTVSCSTPARLYCFGIDHAAVVAPTPPGASARLAFLSTGWVPGGGLASADAQCSADATAAGLSGTFKALLATSTVPAMSRFNTSGGTPWARPDHTLLTATPGALGSPLTYLDAAPTSNAANTLWYSNYSVWSGAASLVAVGTASSTCSNWSSALNGNTGVTGRAQATKVADWRAFDSTGCNQPGAIVCLQE